MTYIYGLSSSLSTYMYRGSPTVMTRSGMHMSPLQSLKVSTLTCPTPLLATTGKPLKSVGSGLPSLSGMSSGGAATSNSMTNALKRSMIFLYKSEVEMSKQPYTLYYRREDISKIVYASRVRSFHLQKTIVPMVSSLEGATKLKLCHSDRHFIPFPMICYLTKLNFSDSGRKPWTIYT